MKNVYLMDDLKLLASISYVSCCFLVLILICYDKSGCYTPIHATIDLMSASDM